MLKMPNCAVYPYDDAPAMRTAAERVGFGNLYARKNQRIDPEVIYAMAAHSENSDLAMDPTQMYREVTFTDRQVGTIRQLTPITADGADDGSRPMVFVGQAQLLTPVGALPLSFEIPATSLSEAVQKFAASANEAAEQTMEELKELRRQAASSIVVPEAGGPGGFPGGGKIQIP